MIIEAPGFTGAESDKMAFRNEVSAAYFDVMRIPLLEGRYLTSAKTDRSQKVVVLNDAAARSYFGSAKAAVNRAITVGQNSYLVVGVTGNTTQADLREAPRRSVYFPLWQGLETHHDLWLAIRTRTAPEPVLAEATSLLRERFPHVVVRNSKVMTKVVDEATREEQTL